MGNTLFPYLQSAGEQLLFRTYAELRAAAEAFFSAKTQSHDSSAVFIVVADLNNVTPLEKTQVAMEVILGRERSCDIARRLGINYDRVRKWVSRQRKNPGHIFYTTAGRPSLLAREEMQRLFFEANNNEADFINSISNLEVKRAFQVILIS